MGAEPSARDLKALTDELKAAAHGRAERIDELERSINEILLGQRRPGSPSYADDRDLERKSAVIMCQDRHGWQHQKNEGRWVEYAPNSAEIDEAVNAQKAFRSILRHGDIQRLDDLERKSLSAFTFSSSGWVVPAQMSTRILSCLTDPTDVVSMFSQETISSGSIQYPIDNVEMENVGWACEFECFGPSAQIQAPGMMELKAEELRCVVCATPDLLQDASFSVEQWVMNKAARAFRSKISAAVMCGDGLGKPVGILHPNSGIPICDTAPNTPPGQFLWQDLVQLKFQVPEQYAARGTYLMNAATLGLVMTMTDAMGRPIWLYPTPATDAGGFTGFQIAGSPVRIVSWMPDVQPGSTPILFADLEQLYMVVTRRATTMQADPYSQGFCTAFKFSARVGGNTICPGAGRLLRIL